MQCRCRKIIITRRVVNNLSNPVMREICYLLMAGLNLDAAQNKLKLSFTTFNTFIDELRQLLIEAGLEVRKA
ncbi:MAG: hypothetical protein PHH77_09155 [Victivallaceae bacterium]|nr:hypothetical protein [Victivallaceae bacterium]